MGHHNVVKTLVDAGADTNHKSHWVQDTVLHHATKYGNVAMVRLLLENGADPNNKNIWGRTPYGSIYFWTQTKTEMASMLASAVCKPTNNSASKECVQLLLTLAKKGDVALLNTLLHGNGLPITIAEDIATFDLTGDWAPVYFDGVVETWNADVKTLLVPHLCRADPTNKNCEIALMKIACDDKTDNTEFVAKLIQFGVDPNYTEKFTGTTALHCSVHYSRMDMARLLVDAGADTTKRSLFYDYRIEIAILVCPWYDFPTMVLFGWGIFGFCLYGAIWATVATCTPQNHWLWGVIFHGTTNLLDGTTKLLEFVPNLVLWQLGFLVCLLVSVAYFDRNFKKNFCENIFLYGVWRFAYHGVDTMVLMVLMICFYRWYQHHGTSTCIIDSTSNNK